MANCGDSCDWTKTLLWITPSCLLTGIIAAFLGQWDTAIGEVAVFVTSVLHWRDPRPGSRLRMLDMIVVRVSLVVHLQAIWLAASILLLGAMVVSIACFCWSHHRDSYAHHAAGWIMACVSNLLLARERYL